MRWCRFDRGDGPRYGIVDGDEVAEVSGTPFGEYAVSPDRVPLAGLRLLVPVVPPTFYAAGTNFREHRVPRRKHHPMFAPVEAMARFNDLEARQWHDVLI